MTAWSIGPVPEPVMLPLNSVCAADQPFGLVGLVEVRYENAGPPHW